MLDNQQKIHWWSSRIKPTRSLQWYISIHLLTTVSDLTINCCTISTYSNSYQIIKLFVHSPLYTWSSLDYPRLHSKPWTQANKMLWDVLNKLHRYLKPTCSSTASVPPTFVFLWFYWTSFSLWPPSVVSAFKAIQRASESQGSRRRGVVLERQSQESLWFWSRQTDLADCGECGGP